MTVKLITVTIRLNIITGRLETTIEYVFEFKYNYNNELRIKKTINDIRLEIIYMKEKYFKRAAVTLIGHPKG